MISVDILGFIFFGPNLMYLLFFSNLQPMLKLNSLLIKILRSDSGGEYMSSEFHAFLHHKDIVSQRSCPYTPQQNGVAERKNRYLLDVCTL